MAPFTPDSLKRMSAPIGEITQLLLDDLDANPSPDQAAGYPPVDRARIVGPVLTVGGSPVTVSGAGPLVRFVRGHRTLLIGLAVAAILVPELLDGVSSSRGHPERGVLRADDVLRPLLVVSFVFCLVLLIWGASTHPMVWVAVSGQAAGASAIPVGEETTHEVTVMTASPVPALTENIVVAEGMTITEKTREGSTIGLTVALPAMAENGPYRTRVHVRPYPATLPLGVLRALHDVHWLVAAVGSILPVFVPVWLIYELVGDGQARLRGPRSRLIRRLGGS